MNTKHAIGIAASAALTSFLAAAVPAPARAEAPPAPAQPDQRLDSALRFKNAPAVTAVRDPHVGARPKERLFLRKAYYYDAYLGRRSVRMMASEAPGRASNVNALDEVPDSSWFENRIGVRDLTPAELHDRPVAPPRAPFAVVGMKVGGVSPGIKVKDANGVGFLLKFDRPDDPDSETAADIVLQRLLWSVGYHTPEDTLIYFRAEDLHVDPKAKMKNAAGESHRMTTADLTHVLGLVGRRADGTYRGLMSKLLDGVPVGGYPQEGVRTDDPNDTIPHEDRREVRGARVFFSWLNHVDVKEDNVLDTWIEDPATPGKGRVRHHLVDFGNSMGVFDWKFDPTPGYAQLWDFSYGARSLVTFGLWKRPWEGVQSSPLRGVGNFESQRFDPAKWTGQYPWAPFERFDRFDGVWGARILMRITPEHIATAVADGQYQDPRSAAYITRTLIERQRKVGRVYLGATSPLEAFTVTEDAAGGVARLCFEDPLLAHFADGEPALKTSTRHRVATWDFVGQRVGERIDRGGAERGCLEGLKLAPDHAGYTIIDIETTRVGTPPGRVLVHVARTPGSGAPRVIGVRRM